MRGALCAALAPLLGALGDRRPNLLRVLTWHRVDEPHRRPQLAPSLISATPQTFERQAAMLAARFRAVSLDDVLEAATGGRPLPPRAVLLTFDDAYADFAEFAWPILKRHALPAVVFVPTAFPGNPQRRYWWDRLHAALHVAASQGPAFVPVNGHDRWPIAVGGSTAATFRRLAQHVKSLPHEAAMQLVDDVCRPLESSVEPRPPGEMEAAVLSWPQLRRLRDEGVAIAAHTRTHPVLTRLPPERIREELAGSLSDLHRELGRMPAVVAWPIGAHNAEVEAAAREVGVRLAFTTIRGVNDLAGRADPLRLRRINVGAGTTRWMLRAQLAPHMRHLNGWWR